MAEVPLTGAVAVEGLATVLRGLDEIGTGAGKAMRTALASATQKAASAAIFIASEKGLRDDEHAPEDGGLIQSIKGGWRGTYGYITATARRVSPAYPEGFNYPALYEYGGSAERGNQFAISGAKIRNRSTIGTRLIAKHGIGEGTHGPRAFLWPAALESEEMLAHEAEAAIEREVAKAGLLGSLT